MGEVRAMAPRQSLGKTQGTVEGIKCRIRGKKHLEIINIRLLFES